MWLRNSLLSYENMSFVDTAYFVMGKSKYTETDFKNKCKELKLIYVGKHTEKKKGNVIEFICNNHCDIGVQYADWSHFRLAKIGCSYCAGKHISLDDILHKFSNKQITPLSDYFGCEKPIKCRCDVCGNIWTTIPKVITANGSGCPKCGKALAVLKETKTLDSFKAELKTINPNIEVIGQYVNTHTPILCRCKIDGFEWMAYPANLLNQSAGCWKCNMSVSERRMLDILDKHNINYIPQYSFVDCRYKYALKFDAFDIDNNVVFEYNGEQHYYPVDFAGKGKEWANNNFQINRMRDAIKTDYCKQNNIEMVVIPYWERKNMENFILNKIKEMNIQQCQQ